jgi:hypothetical protein
MESKFMTFGGRRFGQRHCSMIAFLEKIKQGESVLVFTNNNNSPKEYSDLLESEGISFECKPNIITPRPTVLYNWNGSIRGTIYADPYQSGFIFIPK